MPSTGLVITTTAAITELIRTPRCGHRAGQTFRQQPLMQSVLSLCPCNPRESQSTFHEGKVRLALHAQSVVLLAFVACTRGVHSPQILHALVACYATEVTEHLYVCCKVGRQNFKSCFEAQFKAFSGTIQQHALRICSYSLCVCVMTPLALNSLVSVWMVGV